MPNSVFRKIRQTPVLNLYFTERRFAGETSRFSGSGRPVISVALAPKYELDQVVDFFLYLPLASPPTCALSCSLAGVIISTSNLVSTVMCTVEALR